MKKQMKKSCAEKLEKERISKEMTFQEVLQKYPEAAMLLMEKGMACIGCPMAMQETIEQGCIAHGLDPDEIVKLLNKKLKEKK